ncbi:MAG: hypothetical protein HDR21_02450 [Lachnospiraceae bacterium]|nr:hypothetical protein [Lachnospiraceae bacterium]
MRDFDDRNNQASLARMAMFMGLVMAAILVMVLVINKKDTTPTRGTWAQAPNKIVDSGEDTNAPLAPEQPEGGVTLSGDTRTSDQLDIWDEDYVEILRVTPSAAPAPQRDATTDGYHTKITYADGTQEWVLISSLIKKNTYDLSGFSYQRPIMSYYEEDHKISYAGATVSADQNYVDYIKLKRAGIEFVMLRMGLRDVESGELQVDGAFGQNMKDASDAGLDVGIWFFSEATTEEEVIEEAQMVIEAVKEHPVSYPIAFVPGMDAERSARLTKTERTELALAFCRTIAEAGYLPMIGANKENLILDLDLTKLSEVAIWLRESGDLPDYPYSYTMWSYSRREEIEGIAGDAELCISFQDYGSK